MSASVIIIIDINVRIINRIPCGVFDINVRRLGGILNGKQSGAKDNRKKRAFYGSA